MTCDEELADRVRAILQRDGTLREVRMFGGVCFMVGGHMCCGVARDALMLRLGKEAAGAALGNVGVRPMDFTGRPMAGMVFVDERGCRGEALRRWVELAVAFVRGLPAKTPPKESRPTGSPAAAPRARRGSQR